MFFRSLGFSFRIEMYFHGVIILFCISGISVPLPKNPASCPPTESGNPYTYLTLLESTLASHHVSVDSRALTESLKPLESTLTKKQEEGVR